MLIPLLPVIGIVALVCGWCAVRAAKTTENGNVILSGHCRITHFKNPGIFFCFRVLFDLGRFSCRNWISW